MDESDLPAGLTCNAALLYAIEAHGSQTRGEQPYVVHLIECIAILEDEHGVTDETTLVAAALHDTLEDTCKTRDDLVQFAGHTVASVVMEATDDIRLSPGERKAVKLTLALTGQYSYRARLVMLADKLSNARSLTKLDKLPCGWSEEALQGHLVWCYAIACGLQSRGVWQDVVSAEEVQIVSDLHAKLAAVVRARVSVDVDSPEAARVIDKYLENVSGSS